MNYEQQCVAAVRVAGGGTDRCQREASNLDPLYATLIPVCSWHILKARDQFARPLETEIAELKKSAAEHECDGQIAVAQYIEASADYHLSRNERQRAASLAYFIRCGGYVKIGVSTSPLYRLETIRKTGGVLAPYLLDLSGAELIATEPGGFDREKELHKQFAHLRHTGEWFTESPELTAYIESLRVKGKPREGKPHDPWSPYQ